MTGQRAERVAVTCDGCGLQFEKLPKRIHEKNYCCRNCKDLAGRKPTTEIKCATCGFIFHVQPCRAQKAKYCSDECKFVGRSKSLEERRSEFWSYVEVGEPDQCWPWRSTLRSGYGRFWTGDGFVSAHVEAWEQTHGRVDVVRGTTGIVLRHKCDNRACVNVNHLIPGTQAQNIQDMVDRNRSTKGRNTGQDNVSAKLTPDQVLAIRADTRTQRVIAADYGISHTLVRFIKHRKAWAHLD